MFSRSCHAGGPRSRYAEKVETNCWSGGSKIIPLSYEEAIEWAQENLSADVYEEEFGKITEEENCVRITISLPANKVAAIRRKAKEEGVSISSVFDSLISESLV